MLMTDELEAMGQHSSRESHVARVPYDENGDNGLILSDHYIPEELLAELLCYVDAKTLLNCQLVCKKWLNLMRDYVWRKKAERAFGHSLQAIKNSPWTMFYNICEKNVFEKNLMKNHSGQNGLDQHWNIIQQGGDNWTVEIEPCGTPRLPNDPVFEGATSCFVTSFSTCIKRQVIDLVAEGLLPDILDKHQPPIVVSEWYSCRWDCPAVYECTIQLLGATGNVLDIYRFQDRLQGEKQNVWHHFCYAFENYGSGVRKIVFVHAGRDISFWAGHYGSKMSGASVVIKLKPFDRSIITSNEFASNNESEFLYSANRSLPDRDHFQRTLNLLNGRLIIANDPDFNYTDDEDEDDENL